MPTSDLEAVPTFDAADRCLRIFFSVDIAGSTGYKNRHHNFQEYEKHWARFYDSFFEDFPALFERKVFEQFDRVRDSIKVWKCLGDEIIYEDIIAEMEDAHRLVMAFYQAIVEYDKTVREREGKPALRVKGTCWTAGFPIRNAKIKVPDKTHENGSDYIGPDMDIGFRLAKASRPERVVVSMDLADLLTRKTTTDHLAMYLVGWEIFKGVFGDKPYPIIWVRRELDKPFFLPWEDHLCHLNAKYRKEPKTDEKEMQTWIDGIRDALPELELFAPYFTSDSMPKEHRAIWRRWEKARKNDEDMYLDQGEELAPITRQNSES